MSFTHPFCFFLYLADDYIYRPYMGVCPFFIIEQVSGFSTFHIGYPQYSYGYPQYRSTILQREPQMWLSL